MKQKQKTREELVLELGNLQEESRTLKTMDENRRKDFARAFGWTKSDFYGKDREASTPTWSEIFVQVGKLLADSGMLEIRENLHNMNKHLCAIDNRVFPKKEITSQDEAMHKLGLDNH